MRPFAQVVRGQLNGHFVARQDAECSFLRILPEMCAVTT
ncbi:Uncharacterised protein [Salmonella enterica subsp. enterica]|uniref:Uncharacterized protein n=1 Tax=Salmonella enterica I TaxID=59201 RepID=A0A3S4LZT7_SALET|nr:Uncharacterised protein [Salmonella enterica subsp. enterica]